MLFAICSLCADVIFKSSEIVIDRGDMRVIVNV